MDINGPIYYYRIGEKTQSYVEKNKQGDLHLLCHT